MPEGFRGHNFFRRTPPPLQYTCPLLAPESIPVQPLPSSLFKVLFTGAGLRIRRTPPPFAEMATGRPWRRLDSIGTCWRSMCAKTCGSSTTPIPPHRAGVARTCQRRDDHELHARAQQGADGRGGFRGHALRCQAQRNRKTP